MIAQPYVKMPTSPEVVRLRRSGLWVVWGLPWTDRRWCGPYRSQKEALRGEGGLRDIAHAIRLSKGKP